ncbi:tail fiber protein [Pelagibacter phage HTVC019P]|uniref:C1q domain-containing protein n=1 Tax=Pelagibacter phage HTVC019P TaxID=1283079 RepID=M1I8B3_9CAUD|nr:tail fiber protein [Pelagibacter phage HTVC019P]AGE60617.1 hypothetical protein [Pelagibacter phage HTVC019P]
MYLGNQPALSYTSFAKQDFTTSATTSYTLDNPVTNANELALFINFVRQEPTTAYSASGTTLTLTSATSSSDDMYCVYLGKAVQTVNPPNASVGISQLSATGTKNSTTFLRGDNTFASAGGDNTPAFKATLSGNQTIADNATVKITFDTETFDTNNAFASNKFTVPSGEAGKYNIISQLTFYDGSDHIKKVVLAIYKNGSAITEAIYNLGGENMFRYALCNSNILNLSASDYIEIYGYADTSDGGTIAILSGNQQSYFSGYKLIGV